MTSPDPTGRGRPARGLRAAALLAIAVSCAATVRAAAQHAHGKATLDLGFDGATGRAVFRAPGDDLYGFEREPRTPAERARRDSALAILRNRPATLMLFDPSLGCTLRADSVAIRSGTGSHAEVEARYAIACRSSPAGRPIRFAFSKAFPGVERVAVQLVTETTQTSATITRDRGTITP